MSSSGVGGFQGNQLSQVKNILMHTAGCKLDICLRMVEL